MKALPWLLLLLVLIGAGCGVYYGIQFVNDVVDHHRKEYKLLRDSLQVYVERDQRIDDMRDALLVNYAITLYEAQYYALIFDDFSQKYNIPWEIYPSLIRYESNWRTTLTSSKRCRGITQISAAVAKDMCKKLGIRYYDKIYWNELLNMTLGFTYLSEGILSEDIQHGVRRYVGGSGYRINSVKSRDTRVYVQEYGTTIWREFDRMKNIYMGVQAKRRLEIAVADSATQAVGEP